MRRRKRSNSRRRKKNRKKKDEEGEKEWRRPREWAEDVHISPLTFSGNPKIHGNRVASFHCPETEFMHFHETKGVGMEMAACPCRPPARAEARGWGADIPISPPLPFVGIRRSIGIGSQFCPRNGIHFGTRTYAFVGNVLLTSAHSSSSSFHWMMIPTMFYQIQFNCDS